MKVLCVVSPRCQQSVRRIDLFIVCNYTKSIETKSSDITIMPLRVEHVVATRANFIIQL